MKHAPFRLKQIVWLTAIAFTHLAAADEDEFKPLTVTVYPTEMTNSSHLQQIGVPGAWALKATGQNVWVSVIDTGVNSKNTELRRSVSAGYNTTTTRVGTDTTDVVGHGTHVSGIIAAANNNAGVVGVAPDAKILPLRVADKNGNLTYAAVDRALRIAADNTPIANTSLGGGPGAQAGLQYAVGKGMLLVSAAGNEGGTDPIWPARYAKETWAKGRIIAVGAVDASNVITSWSNRAGDTMNFFLVAPGDHILSTYGTGLAYMSGTSMATPVVTGVAALVKSRWPALKAEQIASILFQTATDLGAPGVDPIYGWGLVNATRAVQPIGSARVASLGGQSLNVASIGMMLPAPAGAALKGQSITVSAIDNFNRDFSFDIAGSFHVAPSPTLEDALNDRGQRTQTLEKVLPDGSRLATRLKQTVIAPLAPLAQYEARNQQDTALTGVSLIKLQPDGRELAFGANGLAHHFFTAMTELDATREASALGASPVFSLVPGHSHLGLGLRLNDGWKLKAGALTTALAGQFADTPGAPALLKTSLMLSSLTRVRQDSVLSISVGQLNENASLLGSRSGGGLTIDGTPRTRFASLDGAWKLPANWAAFANWTRTYTPAHSNSSASLIAGTTALSADAMSLGLLRADTWRRGDRVSFVVSQPLRIRAGGMGLALPQGEDEAGTLLYGTQNLSLAPASRELKSEINYSLPVGRQGSASGFLMHRANPGHDATAPADTALGLRWLTAF